MSRDGISFGVPKAQLVTISSDEYESMKSTLEIMSDPELMQQIEWNGIIVHSFAFICGSKLARIHKAGCHPATLPPCHPDGLRWQGKVQMPWRRENKSKRREINISER